MIPGLIGFLIQLIVPMITASAIVREKEQGEHRAAFGYAHQAV